MRLDIQRDAESIARRLNRPTQNGSYMRGLFLLDGQWCLYSVSCKSFDFYTRRQPHRLVGVYAPPVSVEQIFEDLLEFAK